MHVIIYTDGACKGNPGKGGWGVIIQTPHQAWEFFGGDLHTTNNKMELTAAIQGLQQLQKLVDSSEIPCDNPTVTVYTDSQYVINGITKWIDGWLKKNWKSSQDKEVANKELWQMLWVEAKNWNMGWEWVKGHASNPGNNRADELANQGVAHL